MNQEQIRDLIISNVNRIENPSNHSDVYVFREIDELISVLFSFLKHPVEEKLVEGVEHKIFNALNMFSVQQIDVSMLPKALEDLSTGFESFLKKIAVIKYESEPVKVRGDGVSYLGLINTTLGMLLEGKVSKVDSRNNSIPALVAPIVTFSYSENTIQDVIYNYVRKSRNEVHVSEIKPLVELMNSFRVIVAAYLFAVEENLVLIRACVDPVFLYLTKLHVEFQKWDARYVALPSEERVLNEQMMYPQQIFEWQDELDYINPSFEDLINNSEIGSDTVEKPLRKSIFGIASEHRAFWLIGEPGSGKSTTLQALSVQRADEILSTGYLTSPFPIYIQANRFDKTTSFLQIMCELLKIDLIEMEKYLTTGQCWLLIDGINEISLSDQEIAFREIQRLYDVYDETPVLLTSRKYNFYEKMGLPVYELLPLTDELILTFLQKNMKSKNIGRQFFDSLIGSESVLLDFARNPLMLRMLAQVANDGDLPENRGQLFRQFMRWIFSRETKLRETSSNPFFVEIVLSKVAFKMRSNGRTNAPHAIVINWIAEVVKELQADIDIVQFFHVLLDSHILELDINNGVTFFHELIQEYFCSLELKTMYLHDPMSVLDFYMPPIWFEPISMFAGLLPNADALVSSILPYNIRLAAKCVWSGASVGEATATKIIEDAEKTVLESLKPKQNASMWKKRKDAYISLLELGTSHSLKTTIKLLAIDDRFPLTNALSSCERPEFTTIKLLRFGLTGKKRVFQCLSALKGKTLSEAILNSSEVATAELLLLEGEIETRSIALIAEIGIPISIKQEITPVIAKIITGLDVTNAKWRSAVVIAANEGFIDDLLERV